MPRLCRNVAICGQVAYNQWTYSNFCFYCSRCLYSNRLEHDDDCHSNSLESLAPPAVPQRSFFARFSGALAAAVTRAPMTVTGSAPPCAEDREGIDDGGSVGSIASSATGSTPATGARSTRFARFSDALRTLSRSASDEVPAEAGTPREERVLKRSSWLGTVGAECGGRSSGQRCDGWQRQWR